MKSEELQAIRERVNKATVGTWSWENIEGSDWPVRLNSDASPNGYVLEACEPADSDDEAFGLNAIDITDNDMQFIAHSREDMERLVNEVLYLRKGLCLIRAKKYPPAMSAVDVAHLYLEGGAE